MKLKDLMTRNDMAVLTGTLNQLLSQNLPLTPDGYPQNPISQSLFSSSILAKHGNKEVSEYAEYIFDNPDIEFHDSVLNLAYELYDEFGEGWCRIFKALVLSEYNPIHNYDRHEETHTTHENDDTNTLGQRVDITGQQSNTKGQQENTEGQRTDQIGAQSTTFGAQTITDATYTNTDTHGVAPYDSDTFHNESRDQHQEGAKEHTDGSHTDSTTARSDVKGSQTFTEGQRIDINGQRSDTKGEETDTLHQEGETVVESEISGNIGTTKTQEMIIDEISLRSKWRFNDIVIKDVVGELTLKIYA